MKRPRPWLVILALAASCSKPQDSTPKPTSADLETARRLLSDKNQPWWNGHAMKSAGEPPKIKMADIGDWAAMNYNPPGTPLMPLIVARLCQSKSELLRGTPLDGRSFQFIDVRRASDFYVERIPGSRNVPVRDLVKFPDDLDRKAIAIVLGDPYPHPEVMERVRSAGFADAYCLEGGMRSWAVAGPIEGGTDLKEYRRLVDADREPGAAGGTTEFMGIGPLALKSLIDARADMKVVFVGDEDTFKAGRIEGAMRTALGQIEADFKDVPKDTLIAVYCGCCQGRAGGYSEAAARKLRQLGFTNVLHLDGHLSAWREAGYPVVSTSSAK
jgi:rhodanese-related sulfurtransferase